MITLNTTSDFCLDLRIKNLTDLLFAEFIFLQFDRSLSSAIASCRSHGLEGHTTWQPQASLEKAIFSQ